MKRDKIILLTIMDSTLSHEKLRLIAQKVTQYTQDCIQGEESDECASVYYRIQYEIGERR